MNKRSPVFSSDELLKEFPLKSKIEGWYFSVEKVAPFVWYARAKSIYGFEMCTSGADEPDFMIEQFENTIIRESLENGMYFID